MRQRAAAGTSGDLRQALGLERRAILEIEQALATVH
jgi:hypothetical protein